MSDKLGSRVESLVVIQFIKLNNMITKQADSLKHAQVHY